MRKVFFLSILSLLAFSCSTTGKVTMAKDFYLSRSSTIAVQSPQNPSIGASIEGELLGLGFNVVPYETAVSAIKTDTSILSAPGEIIGTQTTSKIKYIPSSVVISVNLSFRYYPAATYFLGGNIRILDLSDNRLIANFSYKGNEWTIGNENDIVRLFIKDFTSQVEITD